MIFRVYFLQFAFDRLDAVRDLFDSSIQLNSVELERPSSSHSSAYLGFPIFPAGVFQNCFSLFTLKSN
jgi:hypothetical protein